MIEKLYGHELQIKDSRILSVQINLLNKCTSHCKSCRKYTWPDNMLEVEVVMKALRVLKESYGLETVVFSGGDPLLYPQLPILIEFCEMLGLKFSLITTLITNDIELLGLIARKAERIHVSLDAASRKYYLDIRGVDAFNIVERNIYNVQAIRFKAGKRPIRLSSTISKLNFHQTAQLFNFARLSKCDLNYYLVHTWDELKMEKIEIGEFYADMTVIARIDSPIKVNAIEMLQQRYGREYQVEKCSIPKIHALIDSDGSIYPCCKLLDDNGEYNDQIKYAYGNIHKDSIRSEFAKRFQQTYPLNCEPCKECSDRYKPIIKHINSFENVNKEPLFL